MQNFNKNVKIVELDAFQSVFEDMEGQTKHRYRTLVSSAKRGWSLGARMTLEPVLNQFYNIG